MELTLERGKLPRDSVASLYAVAQKKQGVMLVSRGKLITRMERRNKFKPGRWCVRENTNLDITSWINGNIGEPSVRIAGAPGLQQVVAVELGGDIRIS